MRKRRRRSDDWVLQGQPEIVCCEIHNATYLASAGLLARRYRRSDLAGNSPSLNLSFFSHPFVLLPTTVNRLLRLGQEKLRDLRIALLQHAIPPFRINVVLERN